MLAVRDEMAPGAKPSAIVPRNFAEAQQMCGALARSGLVPKAYIERPENMIVTVMSGAEVGLPPMQSLRLYHILDDVPRLGAEGVRAIILASPSCEYFEFVKSSDTEATWIGKRPGRPEKSVTWTIERAKRAGLANKANWQKSPEDMLNARASMQLGRLIWPEICAGMVSREEALDGDFLDAQYTERVAKPTFVAPAAPERITVIGLVPSTPDAEVRAAVAQVKAQPAAELAPAPAEPPKRGSGRPPKDKPADPTTAAAGDSKASSPAATGTQQIASSDSSATSSAKSPASSSAASDQPAPEKKPAAPIEGRPVLDVYGQTIGYLNPPTHPDSSTAPSPSAESAQTSSSETPSGAEHADRESDDPGFGEDPVDAQPAAADLTEFYAWVAGCKTQRDLRAGLPRWRAWSVERFESGDKAFEGGKNKGKGTLAMQEAFSARKAEVPE